MVAGRGRGGVSIQVHDNRESIEKKSGSKLTFLKDEWPCRLVHLILTSTTPFSNTRFFFFAESVDCDRMHLI